MTGVGSGEVELMIERWSGRDKHDDYHWSVWRDGRRIAMGMAAHDEAGACEAEGLAACRRSTGRAPDRITRL